MYNKIIFLVNHWIKYLISVHTLDLISKELQTKRIKKLTLSTLYIFSNKNFTYLILYNLL